MTNKIGAPTNENYSRMDDLAFKPATELARLIEAGELDPPELTRVYLGRAEGIGRDLNCFVTFCAGLAMTDAAAAAKRARSKQRLSPRLRQRPKLRLGPSRRLRQRQRPTTPKPPPSPSRARTIPPSSSRRPVSVAITGSIGAGKSELLRAFARHGAAVISSDDIVHRLIREDPEVKQAMVDRLGPEILGTDGEIVRSRVAERVFADPEQLAWLEALLHPPVVATYLAWRDDLARLDPPPAVCVTEVPLLYEVGGEAQFDKVVAVTAAPGDRKSVV